MGIPAFYRWLTERYPLSVVDAVEESPIVVNGVKLPVDTSRPNPNGMEFDNLYIDMNGIIHPCFHPEGLPPPKSYDEVFKHLFLYVDRVFSIVRPRKLLYLAIDGVAPRAKMNQQRSRRFRTAKEAADEARGKCGGNLTTKKLDSNIITPGTEFMAMLSDALRYFVHMRMNNDTGWRGIKVIVSDASVPGEGEHKIMSYIRLQRNRRGFDPNTRHCLYGLDADLIMLALATHEIHFSVLREDFLKAQKFSKSPQPIRHGNRRKFSEVEARGESIGDFIMGLKFQFLNIWVVREYLAYNLRIQDPSIKVDFERLIDDFVFMCLFVGNDFLPHVPSLEIFEGAIDLLMSVYKREFVRMGGYLTNCAKVNLKCVEYFLQALGSYEDAIFRKRSQVQKEREIRFGRSSFNGIQNSVTKKTDAADFAVDKVKLGEKGWKNRYYNEKFKAETDDRDKVAKVAVLKYIEGICWVMHYYYQGVCSWQWFYPYHYAPFASDFSGLHQLEIEFTLGKPFKPLDQLMGVLPAASASALPLFYQKLMTDSSSPMSEFYPIDFEVDLNGRRRAWQGVCKLPFIDECILLSEIAKVEHTLTDEERERNSTGLDMLFVHKSHPLATKIISLTDRWGGDTKSDDDKVKWKVKPKYSDGMNGYVYISNKPVCPGEICSPIDGMEAIQKNEVISAFYKYPKFHTHLPTPPDGVIMPKKSIFKRDILPPPMLWHKKSDILGRVFPERRQERRCHGGQNYTDREPPKWGQYNCGGGDTVIEGRENKKAKRGNWKKNATIKQEENVDAEGGNYTNHQLRKKEENECLSLVGKEVSAGEPMEQKQDEDPNSLGNGKEQNNIDYSRKGKQKDYSKQSNEKEQNGTSEKRKRKSHNVESGRIENSECHSSLDHEAKQGEEGVPKEQIEIEQKGPSEKRKRKRKSCNVEPGRIENGKFHGSLDHEAKQGEEGEPKEQSEIEQKGPSEKRKRKRKSCNVEPGIENGQCLETNPGEEVEPKDQNEIEQKGPSKKIKGKRSCNVELGRIENGECSLDHETKQKEGGLKEQNDIEQKGRSKKHKRKRASNASLLQGDAGEN